MLQEEDIVLEIKSQGFKLKSYTVTPEGGQSVLMFESESKGLNCPKCGRKGHVYQHQTITLTDAPIWIGRKQDILLRFNRYRCRSCGKTYHEKVPFRHPGTYITERAARWATTLMRNKMPIKAVSEILGISWDTVHRVHKEMMDEKIKERKEYLRTIGYKPKRLAVDEFAKRKGHTYATCVMDLDEGEIIWVGDGRSKADFSRFFEEIPPEYLSEVEAVAMDMNASYNILVSERLPNAAIVYDRYHMQAQFGREVLGAVRLAEAAKHHESANTMKTAMKEAKDPAVRKELDQNARKEAAQYRQLKRLRWTLLSSKEKLNDDRVLHLQNILESHSDLAVCYALKEELHLLFSLRDPTEARLKWNAWFDAAEASNIAPLVHFAQLKRKRIDGLVAHALYPISTGPLEGFNNKIKVAKRVAYGYRDDDYFFTLIRYISLPQTRSVSHDFP